MDRKYAVDKADFRKLAEELVALEAEADVVLGATYLSDSVAIAKGMGERRRLGERMHLLAPLRRRVVRLRGSTRLGCTVIRPVM